MSPQDDVYVIREEDLLETVRKQEGNRSGTRGLATVRESGAWGGARSPARSRGRAGAVVASSLSLFACGAGQAYNGQAKLGLLLFLVEVLAAIGHWSLIQTWPTITSLGNILAIGEKEIFVSVAVTDFLLIFLLLYNVAQAYHQADQDGDRFEGFGYPILSGIASMVLPGWGQLLNAQLGKGLFFLFCLLSEALAFLLLFVPPFSRVFATLDIHQLIEGRTAETMVAIAASAVLTWILSVHDAYLVARYNR